MKTPLFKLFVATAVCISAFAKNADFQINSRSSEKITVVNVNNLTDQDLNEISEGIHPDFAVEFSRDTTLPVSFFLKGDLVNVAEGESNFAQIKVNQTFYARCIQDNLFLSSDLTDWKPFLEFITGNASIAFRVQDNNPCLIVGAEANKRL